MRKVADKIVKYRKWILVMAVLLLIPSGIGYVKTRINYDILTYLPSDLDSMEGQDILNEDYHSASMAMITVENMEKKEVTALEEDIKEIEGVKNALWIKDVTDNLPTQMLPEKIRGLVDNGECQLMLVTFEEGNGANSTIDAIDKIEKLMDEHCFIGGMSAIVHDLKALIASELPIYVLIAVGLCMLILFLGLKYSVVPFIFMIGIGFAVVYNFGTNIFLGEISYITQALAAVLQLAVSMDFSIFLLERYDEELGKGLQSEEAMSEAIVMTFASISGSSLTTIAGFLAMCTMDLKLGTDMGLVMAKGVVFGVLSTVIILPALILCFDKSIHKHQHKTLIPSLPRLANFTTKHYLVILICAILLFVPMGKAQKATEVYYNLIDSLPNDLTSTLGTEKLRNEFNMTTSHFVLIPNDLDSLQEKAVLETLNESKGMVSVVSLNEFVGPGVPDSFIPGSVKELMEAGDTKMILANSEYKAATDEANQQLAQLNRDLKEIDERILITGEGALNKDLVEIAGHDIQVVNIVSMLLVFLIIAFVFKSISIPVLLVATIELAITINMGIPYFTGESIPFIASIVIGTIQLGATIDYAILMTSRYQEERNKGIERIEAVRNAARASTHSILVSGLSFFVANLGVAMVSRIALIQGLCAMLAKGALISMIVILLVLPSVLIVFGGLVEKTSYHFIKKGESN